MNTHSDRLERWLGAEQVEQYSRVMRGWYGPPIPVFGAPGVKACGDGDFVGRLSVGAEATLRCFIGDVFRRRPAVYALGAGFASLAEFLSQARNGRRETVPFYRVMSHSTGRFSSMWAIGSGTPAAGSAGAAAPGGTAHASTSTGAINQGIPIRSGETLHYAGGSLTNNGSASTLGAVLLYDRLFSVAKTMSSTATEAVTGVPTRYTGTTPGASGYAAGNFLFPEVTSTLGATAHNWTVCQYTDQDGNTGTSAPSAAGVASMPANVVDLPSAQWFMPLAAGDCGLTAITQIQCDASVTGGVNFVMGRPVGWLPTYVFGYRANVEAVRSCFSMGPSLNDACLTMLSLSAGSNAGTLVGTVEFVAG